MLQYNFFILPIAALIPLIIGFIWYHPNVFGKQMTTADGNTSITHLSISKIAIIYLFSLLMCYLLMFMTVHQSAVFQLFFMDPALDDPDSAYNTFIKEFMSTYGDRHRSFGHGIIHGTEIGFLFSLGFLGITFIYKGIPVKKAWIHVGYWVICLALMSGLICAFL